MPGLSIDWMQLESAFESHAPDQRALLDRRTGELKVFASGADLASSGMGSGMGSGIGSGMGSGGPDGENAADWIRVEPIPSREQYRMMERFIATVVNVPLKDALQDAIVGKGAFRRFKDAVSRHPEERKRWFAFRDALLHRYILDWLKQHKLELQEIPAWNLEPPMTPVPELYPTELGAAVDAAHGASAEGAPVTGPGPDRAEVEALRTYLQAWARSHGEEYRYLFGPAAFDRLASDMTQEFIIYRKRST